MLNSTIKLVLLLFLTCFTNSYSQASKIFWISHSGSKIQSVNLDGSGVTDVVTDLQMAEGIAIDCTSTPKKIYYSERGADRIMRVNFDGTNIDSVVTGVTGIKDIELDPYSRKIYWAKDTYSDDRIQRSDMDSLNSNIVDLFTNSYAMHNMGGVAVDTSAHWIFWSQSRYSLVDVIKRMNYAGSNDTIIGSYRNPKDIDVVNDKIYWIWYGENYLMSAYKNGSNVDTVLTNFNALYFHIDTAAGKIFWSDNIYNKIISCNLDGSEQTDLVTGISSPAGIVAYVNPLTVSVNTGKNIIRKFELKQNYPNPFNPVTTISFSIPNPEVVSLNIYNVLGQKVETLVLDKLSAGEHSFTWNASQHAGGVYFYKLKVASGTSNYFVNTKKLILLK